MANIIFWLGIGFFGYVFFAVGVGCDCKATVDVVCICCFRGFTHKHGAESATQTTSGAVIFPISWATVFITGILLCLRDSVAKSAMLKEITVLLLLTATVCCVGMLAKYAVLKYAVLNLIPSVTHLLVIATTLTVACCFYALALCNKM